MLYDPNLNNRHSPYACPQQPECATAVQSQRGVNDGFTQLETSLNLLNGRILDLKERLHPVLVSNIYPAKMKEATKGVSPMADKLKMLYELCDEIGCNVDGILNSLDI